ncbi:MAG: oligogalacturonate lyase [Acidobacteria bacterium]|nr:oligogalacturonate lyase [Acidobacteriota bacterium]
MPKLTFLFLLFSVATCLAQSEPPTDWNDSDTGHRVIRLSREAGSASLYFHQNAYSPDGKKLIITTPTGLSTINLQTRAIEKVVEGRVNVIVTGRKSGEVYYIKNGAVFATHLDTKSTREIAKLPPRGSIASVNADETLLLGSLTETATQSAYNAPSPNERPDGKSLTFAEQKEVRLNARLEQRIPMAIFTINTKTGEMKTVHRATDWLNHLQFSPTDPNLIMFCHEGPWHKVDRIWTIRTDGSNLTKVHTRTMNMEIAGHEFFSADGKTIWYDLQTPRGEDFWVAGWEIATGARTYYHLQRDEWSVHFNVSPDGKLFAGDGGDNEMVAHAKDGKWIYLFRPNTIPDVAGIKAPNAKDLINPGFFQAERLVNMARHDYRLEPNVTFTPDMKWIVFRSNMHGATHVYAVEIGKAKQD